MSLVMEEEIAKRLAARFPEVKTQITVRNRVGITAPLDSIATLATYLRDVEGFDHVTSVTGIDYPDKDLFTVTYHLGSYARLPLRRLMLSMSVDLRRQNAKLPSLVSIWPSSEYHERETHEMLGVSFQDHPNLNLLLLPEDWADLPPLRKDFKLKGHGGR